MLATVIQEIKDIRDAIGSKQFEIAARKLIAVQQQVIDTLFGHQTMQAASPEHRAALKAACDECAAQCRAVGAAAAPDGHRIAAILSLIQTVLPVILGLFD